MFKKANKENVFIKIAMIGASGSGKSLSALKIAKGLTEHLPPRTDKHEDGSIKSHICVVDTENESASYYSDLVSFDTVVMNPPFSTEKYNKAVDEAIKLGYSCIILDSISHAWSAEGGLLQQKETLDSSGGANRNQYTNWKPITKKHQEFISSIVQSKIDLIATMRAKTAYAIEEQNGKKVPVKIGLEPVQRDGLEYEFGLVFEINEQHFAKTSKDRTNLFDGQNVKIDETVGHKILGWKKGKTTDKKLLPNFAQLSDKPKTETKPSEPGPYTKSLIDKGFPGAKV